MNERVLDPRNPEGLTPNQEILVDLLFTTQIEAPVTKRIALPDRLFRFEKITRPMSPIAFAQEGEFALKLHEKDPSAPLLPVYINLRNLPEDIAEQIGLVLSEVMTSKHPDYCAGIPKAGTPLAEAYSRHSGIPLAQGVFEKGELGGGRKILAAYHEGIVAGINLRLIDDLVTHADTKIEAIEAATQMGFQVTDLVVLVDRQQGAQNQLAELGYTLYAAMTMDQILRYGLRMEHISPEQYQEVASYLDLK